MKRIERYILDFGGAPRNVEAQYSEVTLPSTDDKVQRRGWMLRAVVSVLITVKGVGKTQDEAKADFETRMQEHIGTLAQ